MDVYSVGPPRMKTQRFDRRMALINGVVEARMKALGAPYLETVSLTASTDGANEAYMPNVGGHRVLMRANDGIHMSMAGYLRLSSPVAARDRRWVSRAILTAIVFMLVFNAVSPLNWSRQQPPRWVPETARALSETWTRQVSVFGVDMPRQGAREIWDAARDARFIGQDPKTGGGSTPAADSLTSAVNAGSPEGRWGTTALDRSSPADLACRQPVGPAA